MPAQAITNGVPISAEANRRREFGREKKVHFYARTLERAHTLAAKIDSSSFRVPAKEKLKSALSSIGSALDTLEKFEGFANDFGQIVSSPHAGSSLSVNTNICLISLDGNSFGSTAGAVLASDGGLEKFKKFSDYLDILKASVLAEAIEFIGARNNMKTGENVARFETLLWGGDEFKFVLPAWSGWDFLTQLQSNLSDWHHPFEDGTLSFATGAVFGHHKVPISEICKSADQLSDHAKAHSRTSSLTQLLAYEGVDRTDFSIDDFRKTWANETLKPQDFSVSVEQLENLSQLVRGELMSVGRSALHKWKVYRNESSDEFLDRVQKDSKRISKGSDAVDAILNKSLCAGDSDHPRLKFLMLHMFYDYLLEPKP